MDFRFRGNDVRESWSSRTRHLRTPPLKRAHTESVWMVAISGCGSPPGSSRHYRGSRNPRIEEDVGPCAATLTFIPSPYERDRIRAMDTYPRSHEIVIPAKAGIHYHHEKEARARWLTAACRWHLPGLGINIIVWIGVRVRKWKLRRE